MAKSKIIRWAVCLGLLLFQAQTGLACSMYKITVGDKTMVGNNEDSWRQTSMIRFVPGTAGTFGVAYVGYADKSHPDGAVNEYGLAFDAFTMPSKPHLPAKDAHKKDFSYDLLANIMQQCKTVNEVQSFLQSYNLHTLNGSPLFNGGMLLFVDRTGKYLMVEADTLILGNDDRFVLSNFSYADTPDKSSVKQQRYRNGVAFLQNGIDTGITFCTALSDTMSVHRSKAGDGTLYTSIYDLRDGIIHTYFFHDYSKRISFNLKEELAKGEHTYLFADLFPDNPGYRRFIRYQTPQNNSVMFGFLTGCVLLFFFSFVYFAIRSIKMFSQGDAKSRLRGWGIVLAVLCPALAYYSYLLLRKQAIFYFPIPYSEGAVTDFTSYLPFVLILLLFPLLLVNGKLFRSRYWTGFSRYVFAANNLAFVVLTGLFAYWGLWGV